MLNNKKIFCLSDEEKTKIYLLTTTNETEQILNALKGNYLRSEYHLLTLRNFDKLLERATNIDPLSLQILEGYVSLISEEEREIEVQLQKTNDLYKVVRDLFRPIEMNQLPIIDLTELIRLVHSIDKTANNFKLDAYVDLNNPKVAHSLTTESNVDKLREKINQELNEPGTKMFIQNNPKLILERLNTSLKRLLVSSKIELLGIIPAEEETEMEIFHSFGKRNSQISTTSCRNLFTEKLEGAQLHNEQTKIVWTFLLNNIDYIETARHLKELGWEQSTSQESKAPQKRK